MEAHAGSWNRSRQGEDFQEKKEVSCIRQSNSLCRTQEMSEEVWTFCGTLKISSQLDCGSWGETWQVKWMDRLKSEKKEFFVKQFAVYPGSPWEPLA